jgi:biopolymer transport protein ExbB
MIRSVTAIVQRLQQGRLFLVVFGLFALSGHGVASEIPPSLLEELRQDQAAAQQALNQQRSGHQQAQRDALATWHSTIADVHQNTQAITAARAELQRLQAAMTAQRSATSSRQRALAVRRQRVLAAVDAPTLAEVPAAATQQAEMLLAQAGLATISRTVIDRRGGTEAVPVVSIGAWQGVALGATRDQRGLLNEFGGSASRIVGPRLTPEPAVALPNGWQWVPIDVNGSLATQEDSAGWTWSRFIAAGGVFIWPLFIIAGLGVALIVERSVTLCLLRTPRQVALVTLQSVQRGDLNAARDLVADARTPLARVLAAGLEVWQRGRDAIEAALQGALVHEELRLGRSLRLLAVLAAAAPLLGLLGTVSGMIGTFDVIAVAGTGNPKLLSGGISEALVTTLTGLVVAVPLLLAHALLTRMVERRYARLEQAAMLLHGAWGIPDVSSAKEPDSAAAAERENA